jgi:hypothetical protein
MTQHWKVRIQFMRQYWKLAIHLILKTKHFGVNNDWWAAHASPIGWSCGQKLWGIVTVMPIWRNYQSMKVRSCLGWLPSNDADALGFSQDILGGKHIV